MGGGQKILTKRASRTTLSSRRKGNYYRITQQERKKRAIFASRKIGGRRHTGRFSLPGKKRPATPTRARAGKPRSNSWKRSEGTHREKGERRDFYPNYRTKGKKKRASRARFLRGKGNCSRGRLTEGNDVDERVCRETSCLVWRDRKGRDLDVYEGGALDGW